MLIYPSLALLKKSNKDIHITALVPQYTLEMAKICPWIDEIIIDPGSEAMFSEQYRLLKILRKSKFNAIITLYSTFRIGFLAYLSNIKYRLAPATKIAQIFYNNRLTQRRSRSLKPEYEYNIDVIKKFLLDFKIDSNLPIKPPYLNFNKKDLNNIRKEFYDRYHLDSKIKLIFLHPGTGGSANNLSIEQYANLMYGINIKLDNDYFFVITAGPGEEEYAESLFEKLNDIPCAVFYSTKGLVDFSQHIQLCKLFISGSTGPLHIAGALNIPTAAFYQRLRSATPLRWQTLNSAEKRLAFTPPENAGETDMWTIDTTASAKNIIDFYF